jgi:hypothetical protein
MIRKARMIASRSEAAKHCLHDDRIAPAGQWILDCGFRDKFSTCRAKRAPFDLNWDEMKALVGLFLAVLALGEVWAQDRVKTDGTNIHDRIRQRARACH